MITAKDVPKMFVVLMVDRKYTKTRSFRANKTKGSKNFAGDPCGWWTGNFYRV